MGNVTIAICENWIKDAKWSVDYHSQNLLEAQGKLAMAETLKEQLIRQMEIEASAKHDGLDGHCEEGCPCLPEKGSVADVAPGWVTP